MGSNRDENGKKNKKTNAWKRYGALVMAGMLTCGFVAAVNFLPVKEVQAEEETEKRVTLNIASDEKEDETEEPADVTEETTEAETQTETETETEIETEALEVFDPIASADTSDMSLITTTDVTEVVDACMPSIVAITSKSVEEIETYYYGKQEFEVEGAASGIIVAQNESELLIATNSHVVDGSSELNVCFTAEAEEPEDLIVPAKIKGMARDTELAVIAVQMSDIPEGVREQLRIAKLGSSDALKVGQAAIAIGNALGYGQTVTCGIISALNRPITIDNFSKEVIVTDAAINFGNSGGALLNAKGEVIGINVAKEAGKSSESIGYSIPIDTAIPILKDLVNRETRDKLSNTERGYMGVTVVNVSEDAKELYDMPEGAFVYEVTEGSAADKAGIRKGDIITKFDGVAVISHDDLVEKMCYYKVGETVTIEVQAAHDGEYVSREVEVTLEKGAPLDTGDVQQNQQREEGQDEIPEEQQEENSNQDRDWRDNELFDFFREYGEGLF